MSDISILQQAGLTTPAQNDRARSELGQQDFLKLMITQFKNQDPFKPMDNGDFLGQLAQFSTVNGIESLNSGFSGLAASLQGDQLLRGASLVGHTILAASPVGHLEDHGEITGAVELGASAGNVQIEITNAAGELVQRLDLGEQQAGMVPFTWDGKDVEGDRAPAGHYAVTARVMRGTQVESTDVLLEAEIESVSLGDLGQEMTLNLRGGDTLPVGLVKRII